MLRIRILAAFTILALLSLVSGSRAAAQQAATTSVAPADGFTAARATGPVARGVPIAGPKQLQALALSGHTARRFGSLSLSAESREHRRSQAAGVPRGGQAPAKKE